LGQNDTRCWWLDMPYRAHLAQSTILSEKQLSVDILVLEINFSNLVTSQEETDQVKHRLTFLLAALHARQAVEFFFGLLTAVEVCGAKMRGGPGAKAGNCFV
jgi:hypothetical protein